MLDKLKNNELVLKLWDKVQTNEKTRALVEKIRNFELTKEKLLYALLGTKGIIEVVIALMILFKVQVGVFIKHIGTWFTGGSVFIGFVNLIIFMCICIILGQFMLKEVEEPLEKKVNLSTTIDLSLLAISFVGAIINVLAHKHMFIIALTKATVVSVGAAIFFAILNAVALIIYKKVSERLV